MDGMQEDYNIWLENKFPWLLKKLNVFICWPCVCLLKKHLFYFLLNFLFFVFFLICKTFLYLIVSLFSFLAPAFTQTLLLDISKFHSIHRCIETYFKSCTAFLLETHISLACFSDIFISWTCQEHMQVFICLRKTGNFKIAQSLQFY